MHYIVKKNFKHSHNRGNKIILQAKDNHKFLLKKVKHYSNHETVLDESESIDKAHGRIEIRKTKTFRIKIPGWSKAVVGCEIFRRITQKRNSDFIEEQNKSYYICNEILAADAMQSIVRNHWAIESTNHYIRDTVLFEDANRIRIKPENMMVIRSFGYNLIQANLVKKNFTAQMEANKLNFDNLFEAKGVKYDKSIL
ncbi:MAG: hypothetical protein QG610_1667 [Euryarchaeota archaeon]|nr:hypothetical protein [Euryarchaeota archaeon]